MEPISYNSRRPDTWAVPRWRSDPCERRRIYGPIQPMEEEHRHGFLDWLLGRTVH